MPRQGGTRQAAAVDEALQTADGFASAQDLHARMLQRGSRVGLTTVYRRLQALADEGQVDVLQSGGETRYRRCATGAHHHHLVCRECGRSVEVSGAEVERWATRTARQHGFGDVTHTVEVFGRCRECLDA